MASANSREQNYWPGFVDALTNVVLVMVFVVIVFAVSILYYGYELTLAQIKQISRGETDLVVAEQQDKLAESEQKIKELEEKLAKALAELKRSNSNAAEVAGVSGKSGQSARSQATENKSPVVISGHAGNVVVSYALGVVDLEPKLLTVIDSLLGSYRDAASWQVELSGEFAEASFTEGQRLSFYRIAVLRNYLVSKGVNPAKVQSLIKDPARQATRSRVTIVVRKG